MLGQRLLDELMVSRAFLKPIGFTHIPFLFAIELTIDDVSELNDKFWNMHRDPALTSDGAAGM